MKISATSFAHLDHLVGALNTDVERKAYRNGDFPRSDRVRDLDKRYRWDLLWRAAAFDRSVYDIFDAEDLTSDHIDTALRAIVPPL